MEAFTYLLMKRLRWIKIDLSFQSVKHLNIQCIHQVLVEEVFSFSYYWAQRKPKYMITITSWLKYIIMSYDWVRWWICKSSIGFKARKKRPSDGASTLWGGGQSPLQPPLPSPPTHTPAGAFFNSSPSLSFPHGINWAYNFGDLQSPCIKQECFMK